MSERSVRRRLRRLIRIVLEESPEPVEHVHDRTFLPDVLGSTALTRLVTLVEREWRLEIEDDELNLTFFENIDSLSRFITNKTAVVDEQRSV